MISNYLLSEIDKAYIAGLIDGEGSFMSRVQWQPRKDWGSGMSFRPQIDVAQRADRSQVLDWLKNNIGGYVANRYSRDHMRYWNLTGKERVLNFTKQIQPYLQIKQKSANIIIEMCSKKLPINSVDFEGWFWILDKTEEIYKINSEFRPDRLQKSLQRLNIYREWLKKKQGDLVE